MTSGAETSFRSVNVSQGETRVSRDPEIVLTTLLGSCGAACLYDPFARVGGINHYLLAHGKVENAASMQRYGVHAMEMLINEMMAHGAMRSRMKARIFGGATMNAHYSDIGGDNIAFARAFLKAEGIPLVGEDVGGSAARRVQFRAALGLARCRKVEDVQLSRVAAQVPTPPAKPVSIGDVELF